MAFLIFFGVVLIIYLLGNYYIFMRGLQAIPAGSVFRPYYVWIFWLLAATYVAGRILENIYLSTTSDVLVWTGSFWLGAMLYFFLIVILFDLLRMVNHFLPFFPALIVNNMEKARLFAFAGTVVLVGVVLTAGHINTLYPRVKTLEISIPGKTAGKTNQIDAVLVSDIHLGSLIGTRHLNRIIEQVDTLRPDIVLLAGDILDEDLGPVIRKNAGETLRRLDAPLGVYGIMGNHEHIGGSAAAEEYLKAGGIRIIRDSVVRIADSFYLIGRDDRDKARFGGQPRKSLSELVSMADHDFPLILMDHQPFYLEKASRLGIDLQLSGHTHHGQLWPLNYITEAIYALSYGYKKMNGMHTYVTNGVGTWGPPIRVGNRPEIVHIKMRFGKEADKKEAD